MTDAVDFDITTDEEPPPPPPRVGRPGRWELMVKLADEKADEAPDEAPWVISAKAGPDGTRQGKGEMSTQAFYKLRDKYGPGSEFAEQNGYHFEMLLTDRHSHKKGSSKGVFWVRRVGQRKAG